MLDIVIFNVGLGQCVFFYPRNNPDYGLMVDCGDTPDFKPIDFLISKELIYFDGKEHILSNLTLTNYDHDHFSGLPYLQSNVRIRSIKFAKNLTADEIDHCKPDKTDALASLLQILRTYTSDVDDYSPPYTKMTFYLEKSDFEESSIEMNNLSQIVFLQYLNSTICIPGDLEQKAWQKIMLKSNVLSWLSATNIFVASHHGRQNGYESQIFDYCKPECIIMSDKSIMHNTQVSMASIYGQHVVGNGIVLNDDSYNPRKVLTTRNDGHIWIHVSDNGYRSYKTF